MRIKKNFLFAIPPYFKNYIIIFPFNFQRCKMSIIPFKFNRLQASLILNTTEQFIAQEAINKLFRSEIFHLALLKSNQN